jgi:hypothetical protein
MITPSVRRATGAHGLTQSLDVRLGDSLAGALATPCADTPTQ